MATQDQIIADYQRLLGRAPDDAGLQWAMNSGMTADQLANSIQGSQEYQGMHPAASSGPANANTESAEIGLLPTLYNQYFGRNADQAGTNYWTDQINHGLGTQDLINQFKSSPEYHPAAFDPSTSKSGGDQGIASAASAVGIDPKSDPSGFLNKLYQMDYGRAGDQAGLDFWSQQLKNGVAPDQIVQKFYGSKEFQTDHPDAYAGLNPATNNGAYTGDGIWANNTGRKNPDGTPWNGDVGSRYYGLPGATGPGGVATGAPMKPGQPGTADPNADLRAQRDALRGQLSQLQQQLAGMSGTNPNQPQVNTPTRPGAWIGPGDNPNNISNLPPNYLIGSAALMNMSNMTGMGYGPGGRGPVTPQNLFGHNGGPPMTPPPGYYPPNYVPAPSLSLAPAGSAAAAVPFQGPPNPMIPPPPL
jgi:hypothetical protein